jgi:acyl carrier protein
MMADPRAQTADETLEVIRTFIRRRFPLATTAKVADGDSLLDSGIVDSLGILDLVAFLEKTFSIRVGDDELDPSNFDSIASVARFVASKRA